MNVADRRGVTLLELLVTLCVLAITTAVVAVATSPKPRATSVDSAEVSVRDASAAAIRAGRPVTIVVERASGVRQVTAFPDGRVVEADRDRGIERDDGGGRAPR